MGFLQAIVGSWSNLRSELAYAIFNGFIWLTLTEKVVCKGLLLLTLGELLRLPLLKSYTSMMWWRKRDYFLAGRIYVDFKRVLLFLCFFLLWSAPYSWLSTLSSTLYLTSWWLCGRFGRPGVPSITSWCSFISWRSSLRAGIYWLISLQSSWDYCGLIVRRWMLVRSSLEVNWIVRRYSRPAARSIRACELGLLMLLLLLTSLSVAILKELSSLVF